MAIIYFCVSIILSTGNAAYILDVAWLNESIKFTIKFIIFLCPFVIIFSDKELLEYRKCFFRGLFISCMIQLIWEFLQITIWSKFNISINKVIFGDILNIQIKNSWTFISDGRFRPSGVSWEPANLALSLIIGFVLSKNIYFKMLYFIVIVLSTSRTGIIVLMIIILCDKIMKKRNNIRLLFSIKDLIILIMFLLVFIVIGYYSINNTREIFNYVSNGIRVTYKKIANIAVDSSALTHIQYYEKIITILKNGSLSNALFGYGTSAAGFPYSKFLGIYTSKTGWNPESDFITLLFGNGFVGLITYYIIIFRALKYNKKIKSIL